MAGNQGDQGDQGDAGFSGVFGGTGGHADRVDLPFITEPEVAEQRTSRQYYGNRHWASDWNAWRYMTELEASGWRTTIDLPGPDVITTDSVDEEINKMRRMALDERPDALGEIVSQAHEFISYFLTVMGGKTSSHPATNRVFHIANLAATLIVMHFKDHFDRARPHHICPGLLPPIEVPGHASYPSGHATQAHLFALCAKHMLAEAPLGESAPIGVVLDALAARIARNREIAGVHYPSDSMVGKLLADAIFEILKDETKSPRFGEAIAAARKEWS